MRKYDFDKKHILTSEEAVQDCLVLSKLISSILKDGKIKNSGCTIGLDDEGLDPYEASCEEQRMKGILDLMDKYNYGWYFTVNTKENRVLTQDEQIQNVVAFQLYILTNVGKNVANTLVA